MALAAPVAVSGGGKYVEYVFTAAQNGTRVAGCKGERVPTETGRTGRGEAAPKTEFFPPLGGVLRIMEAAGRLACPAYSSNSQRAIASKDTPGKGGGGANGERSPLSLPVRAGILCPSDSSPSSRGRACGNVCFFISSLRVLPSVHLLLHSADGAAADRPWLAGWLGDRLSGREMCVGGSVKSAPDAQLAPRRQHHFFFFFFFLFFLFSSLFC